jgi:hypothetical protein
MKKFEYDAPHPHDAFRLSRNDAHSGDGATKSETILLWCSPVTGNWRCDITVTETIYGERADSLCNGK